jgi:DNA end-binding protein Ku
VMPQAVWTGNLSFGLVNIPIKLYAATSPRRVRFHQYEAGTGRRIRYRRVAEGPESERAWPEVETQAPIRDEPGSWDEPDELEDSGEDTEVAWEDIVKGYEVEPGRVVTVEAEELGSVAPEPSHVLEVERFVDLEDIDPVHFEKTYYVVPQRGAVSERPYWLLYRAMEEANKVAIGRFVMRTKEYLVAVRPAEHLLTLATLFYADEVRDPKEVWTPSIEEPSERELSIARQLIETLAGEWLPDRRRDEHRERLLDLIHSKLDEAVSVPETEVQPSETPVGDLMDALRASVEAARQAREDPNE